MINQDFYGLQANWINIGNARYELKKPAWTDSATAAAAYGSLDTLVRSPIYNSENMATVPLDNSIVPWKVNENSKVFRRKYCELSFPNHASDPPAIADYFDQSANYKESEENAIKNVNGYRFFLAYYTVNDTAGTRYIENPWDVRYSPYNYKNEFLNGTSGTHPYKNIFPIVSFNYSKSVTIVKAALIPKTYLDDSASISHDPSVNKYYNNRTPDYQANYKDLATLTDSDLTDNYLVGFLFSLYSGGSTQNAGTTITVIPFDNHLPTPAGEWGGTTGQGYPYQTDFTCYTSWIMSDSSRVRYCQLGGASTDVNPANCGIDGAEPATYNAQYYETQGMRTMNSEDFEGEGLEVGSWTITTNTGSGSLPNGRVVSWFIPKCYNNMSIAEIRAALFKELAYLGFIFTDDIYYARYVDTENHPEKYYVPEINSQGVTTGNYKPYSEAEEYINYEWNTDVYERTPYDPSQDQGNDPNVYDNNRTVLNPSGTNIYQKFSTRYLMTQAQLSSVASYLFNKISSESDSDFWSSSTLYVNNPLDVITQLTFYPIDLTNFQDDVYRGNVILGSIDTEINTFINRKQNVIIDLGSCTYYPVYGVNDFRSYPPYSSAQLIIPYCGSCDIDPNLYLNHTISVKMIIDTMSGSCLALIYRDEMVVDTLAGQIGINIPVSGIQSQTVASAERQAQSQLKMARLSSITQFATAAASIAGGLTMGTGAAAAVAAYQFTAGSGAKALENIENAKFNLEHIEVPFKQVGTATPSTSYANERKCRLIIRRPVMMDYDSSVYENTTGYACLESGTVSDFTGYTEFQSVKLDSIAATEAEKTLLNKLLQSGVYL